MKLKWIKSSICLGLFCIVPFLQANDEETTVTFNGLFVNGVCSLQIIAGTGATTQNENGENSDLTLNDLKFAPIVGTTLTKIGDTGTAMELYFDFKMCGSLTSATLSFATASTVTYNEGAVFPLTRKDGETSVYASSLGLAVAKSSDATTYLPIDYSETAEFVDGKVTTSFFVVPVVYAEPPAGVTTENLEGTIQINIAYE